MGAAEIDPKLHLVESPSSGASDDEDNWDEERARREYVELPIGAFSDWDKVGQIKAILRNLRLGIFRDAAILGDQMLEDDRISGDLTTRLQGLLGTPLDCQPALPDNDEASKIAKLLETGYEQIVPDPAAAEIVRWGLFIGVGLGELVWDTSGPQYVPRLKPWHPQFLTWRWDERRFYLITADASQVPLPRTERHIHSDGKWVLYTPYGYAYGWLKCLLRSLAMPWLIRQWTYRDWARRSEEFGQPTKKVITPVGYAKGGKAQFGIDVRNMGSEPTVILPQGKEGESFDLQYAEVQPNGWEMFDKLIDRTEKSISIRVLGQDSSNRAQGGSLADAKENIRDDYKRFDAVTFDGAVRSQILHWWAEHNFGDGKLAPRAIHDVEPADDIKDQAAAYQALAIALPNLVAAGADGRKILEEHGIPLRPEGEPPPAGASPSPPQGSGPKAPPSGPNTSSPPGGGAEGPPTQAMVAAAAEHGPAEAAVAASEPAPAAGEPSPKAPLYQNRLIAKAKARAASALEPDLATLREEIAASKSPDDLKKRLIQRFKEMDPTSLAKIVERTRIMAHLEGRHHVLKKL